MSLERFGRTYSTVGKWFGIVGGAILILGGIITLVLGLTNQLGDLDRAWYIGLSIGLIGFGVLVIWLGIWMYKKAHQDKAGAELVGMWGVSHIRF